MNFNSVQFLIFLPAVLFVYGAILHRETYRNAFLLIASYIFYMSWDWRYAGLILFSTLVDFVVGKRLGKTDAPTARKALLTTSLVLNLGFLAIFKYFNFFMDTTESLFVVLGITDEVQFPHLRFLLPVGISFYTFQTLSYTIDVYWRQLDPEPSFVKFALFVSFFPQLVAGPIVRAAEFLPQLRSSVVPTRDGILLGAGRVFRGLFKKIVIADMLAGLGVDAIFADPGSYSSATLLLAIYGYSFQIYNDFSGYSDIAIGCARMMGFWLPENFRRPYISRSPKEFWTRWHITLSTWLRDYLYIPLGGNRISSRRTRVNLMVTMLLGGLWHGAALNFIFWGAWHGLLLIAYRTVRFSEAVSGGRALRQRLFCFHLIGFSWLLFRIGSFDQLITYLRGLGRFTFDLQLHPAFLLVLGLAAAIHFTPQAAVETGIGRYARLPVPAQGLGYAFLILLLVGFSFGTPAFIYFQF